MWPWSRPMTQRIEIDVSTRVHSLVDRWLKIMEAKVSANNKPRIEGGIFMYVVKADNSDVPYTITPPTATDSEGNKIPNAELSYSITSDNESAVALIPDDDENPLTGVLRIGGPGDIAGVTDTASIMVEVSHGGEIIGAFGAQFVITPGDVAAIQGGGISFEGLTETEEGGGETEGEETEPTE